jgi:hypothetical protein
MQKLIKKVAIRMMQFYSLTWKENVAQLLRLRRVCAKVVMRLKRVFFYRCFSSWYENMSYTHHLAKAAAKIVFLRWHLRLLSIPYLAWMSRVHALKRLRRTASKIILRWTALAVSMPFSTWRQDVSENKRLQRAVTKVLGHWRVLDMSLPYRTWKNNTVQLRLDRSVMDKMARRMTKVVIYKAYVT